MYLSLTQIDTKVKRFRFLIHSLNRKQFKKRPTYFFLYDRIYKRQLNTQDLTE